MAMKIKLGLINFTNCLPINYTLEKQQNKGVELIYGNPARINRLMRTGILDAAPVSSVEYLKNTHEYTLVETACINSDGECGSVLLFSEKKPGQLKKVALPCDSATSSAMLKILLNNYDIDFSVHDYTDTGNNDAALFIGDNALKKYHSPHGYSHVYDIGGLWRDFTGYPAVFGTWVRKRDKFPGLDDLIPEAIATGLSVYFNEIVKLASENLGLNKNIIEDYLLSKIKYDFTERHKKSLEIFKENYTRSFSDPYSACNCRS